MKRVFIIIALMAASVAVSAQSFSVGSYNIRYNSSKDKENGDGWDVRSKALYDLVNYERWEIFGAQEVLHGQLNDLMANLDGYDYIGVGRNDDERRKNT